jgi:DNA polymerase III subunit epsilon
MILLSLDFETTGLDREKDRITEVGAVLWSTKANRAMETASFFVQSDVSVSKEVEALTGINNAMLKKFGRPESDAIDDVIYYAEQADAFIGQNVIQFDKHFLDNAAKRLNLKVPDILWIDTRTDLPLSVESKSLSYMACDHGFLNPFPHNAVGDALTVLKIASMYSIDDMVARAKEPNVVLSSLQKFEDNAAAKKLKFFWKPEFKKWLRVVKASDVDVLAKSAPFGLSVEKGITPQQVWYS